MVGVTVLCAAAAVLRWFELQALPFRWDISAYGSIVWMIYGLHSFHLATSVVENAAFTALCFIGPFEKKHLVDVHVSANYCYFVVASWLPLLGLVLGDAWGGS